MHIVEWDYSVCQRGREKYEMKEEQLYWQNLRHLVLKKRRRRYMAPNCTGMVSDKWERGSVTYHVHILFVQATETENETFP